MSASAELERVVEGMAQAICQETCAHCGERACWEIFPDKWPNKNCDSPGCHALAGAAALHLSTTHRLVPKECTEGMRVAGDIAETEARAEPNMDGRTMIRALVNSANLAGDLLAALDTPPPDPATPATTRRE